MLLIGFLAICTFRYGLPETAPVYNYILPAKEESYMAKRQKQTTPERHSGPPAEITPQAITDTIEKNYMPYVMTVIISRAIPEIDGFKPAHRKLLYTMYKMGLLTGARTKSANVVGQTMRLNPHGDAAIYETMVRLTRGHEALLHPFVDSKGSFGKQYSRDMAYAASRYTEVKLDAFCRELFRGIDKNAVDFIDNYDGTMQEPVLLPTSFPNVLVSPNIGIAVGMASSICSFNLAEICDGTIAMLSNPDIELNELMDLIKAPDFAGGAYIIYNRAQLKDIYRTGRGSFRMRARYAYDKSANCIEILQIPYSTSIELILKRLTDLVKEGKLKEITDFRDEIDLSGFKLTIDLRRGTDPDLLMTKLFKLTPLEDDFGCNFNILVDGSPRQMGIQEILTEWIRFRIQCVRRELAFDLEKKKDKLHLLLGLGKILLDIDRAIAIIRGTEAESDVIPNLMAGFSLDQTQAEYIAEIRLRNLNREYIVNRTKEIEDLQTEIAELTDTINSERKIRALIAKQLREIKETYGKPRKTQLIYNEDIKEYREEHFVENYNVKLVLTRDGYFKKITLLSLRGSDEQKLKDGDAVRSTENAENTDEILFFTDHAQVYKSKISDFECVKASALGDFIPAKLGFEDGERVVAMKALSAYPSAHHFIFIFENGKGVRVPVTAYQTKSQRKKLTGAFSAASPVTGIFYEADTSFELLLISSAGKALLVSSGQIPVKATRSAVGVQLMTLRGRHTVTEVLTDVSDRIANASKFRKSNLPAAGSAFDPAALAEATAAPEEPDGTEA